MLLGSRLRTNEGTQRGDLLDFALSQLSIYLVVIIALSEHAAAPKLHRLVHYHLHTN